MNRVTTLRQQLTLVNSSYVNEESNKPLTESYLPDCLFIALEQQANTVFNIPDFNRLFGEHSFHFMPKKREKLDIHFGRYEYDDYYSVVDGYISGYIANKLCTLYGLKVGVTSYAKITAFTEYLIEAFNQKKSIICEYSARCIPERVEDYQKHYGYHIAIFRGYNLDKQTFIIDDVQKCGMEVSLEDFIHSFDDILSQEGAVNIFTLEKVEHGQQYLSSQLALEEIQRNIDGIYSNEPYVGLNAIEKFMQHILYLPSVSGPYIVPGVWIFSLQRHSCIAWLTALQKDFPQFNIDVICQKMKQDLFVLAKKWKELEYLMILSAKSLKITGSSIYQRFEELFVLEKEIVPLWRELQATLSGGTNILPQIGNQHDY
ncbi:hypothetical protein [Paraglaciecola sp.]|uniref:hypothetical protein n=1 Tax=Paraglaciecola sp. TaxID=1920173 RepID=UPI0030F3AD94